LSAQRERRLPHRVVRCIKEITMLTTQLRLPELGLIAGTRGMLGAGVALLLADKLNDQQRRGIGWTLLAIGAVSTIPLAMMVFGRRLKADV